MSNTKMTDKQKVTTMADSDYVFGNFGGKVGQMSITDFRSSINAGGGGGSIEELNRLNELITSNTTEIAHHGNKLNNYADTFPQNPVASSESNGLMSTADKTKVDNYPEQFVLDLGILNSQEDGEREAAKSEVAGNRNISFIRFQVRGVSELKTILIMQWPNGIHVTAQIMCVDKTQWRRNVTGATGVVGATTNAYTWERTAPHKIDYNKQRRTMQLKDYENQAVSQEVELPLASYSQDGLMSIADKEKISDMESELSALEARVAALENK